MKSIFLFIFLIFILNIAHAEDALHSSDQHHVEWSELLAKHVVDGVVNYTAFRGDIAVLNNYLDVLDNTHPSELPEKERLAFYINAYNAYTVKLILDNFKDGNPVASIKDLGGFFSTPWKKEFCRVGGELLSLDNIEHDIIRPQFKDARVHFGVNCASKSCPRLISAAYEGNVLDNQLDENSRFFINDRKFNYMKEDTLYISKIFKWFSEDFGDNVVDFIKQYADEPLLQQIESAGVDISVKYLPYDWTLNGK